jgi:hypothetical protein
MADKIKKQIAEAMGIDPYLTLPKTEFKSNMPLVVRPRDPNFKSIAPDMPLIERPNLRQLPKSFRHITEDK